MPSYNFDPRKHNAAPLLLPNDDYEFSIKSHKFTKSAQPNAEGIVPFGVMYVLEITQAGDPTLVGKSVSQTCWLHSEKSGSLVKQFMMAALGYPPNDPSSEGRFNEDFGDEDWSADSDAGTMGSGWARLVGARIGASTTVTINKNNGREQNNFRWFVSQ